MTGESFERQNESRLAALTAPIGLAPTISLTDKNHTLPNESQAAACQGDHATSLSVFKSTVGSIVTYDSPSSTTASSTTARSTTAITLPPPLLIDQSARLTREERTAWDKEYHQVPDLIPSLISIRSPCI